MTQSEDKQTKLRILKKEQHRPHKKQRGDPGELEG
jgi:hypothetical protein